MSANLYQDSTPPVGSPPMPTCAAFTLEHQHRVSCGSTHRTTPPCHSYVARLTDIVSRFIVGVAFAASNSEPQIPIDS
jgi:hypothetical protein